RFYTETLGLPLQFRAGSEWAEVRAPGLAIGLHPAGPRQTGASAGETVSIGFQVDDLEATIANLQAQGVTFAPDIQENGMLRLAFFSDPDQTPLYLTQLRHSAGPR